MHNKQVSSNDIEKTTKNETMKNTIAIICLFFSSIAFSNNQSKQISQKKIDSIINLKMQLIEEIDSLKQLNSTFKIEKNYFQTALQMQTGIFTLIVTLFSLLVGFVTYKKIIDQISKQKNKFAKTLLELKERNKKLENSFNEHEQKYYQQSGNLNMLISINFEKNKDWKTAFRYSLNAAKDLSNFKDDFKLSLNALKVAMGHLEILKGKDKNIQLTERNLTEVKSILNVLLKTDNTEITELASEMMSLLKDAVITDANS